MASQQKMQETELYVELILIHIDDLMTSSLSKYMGIYSINSTSLGMIQLDLHQLFYELHIKNIIPIIPNKIEATQSKYCPNEIEIRFDEKDLYQWLIDVFIELSPLEILGYAHMTEDTISLYLTDSNSKIRSIAQEWYERFLKE